MRRPTIYILLSITALLLSTLACSTLNLDSLISTLLRDDFSNSSSGWGTGTDSYSSVEYADGGLKFELYEPLYITWSTPDEEVYENVHLEVSVQDQSSDLETMFGFICNEQNSTNAFYYVGVSPSSGYYAFIKSSVALDDVYLQEGTSSVVSDAGSSMRLGMDCGTSSMALYVNGQMVDSVFDSSYPSGSVGLFAASDDESSSSTVIFDDFEMTKLQQ